FGCETLLVSFSTVHWFNEAMGGGSRFPPPRQKQRTRSREPWPEMLVPHLQTYLSDHRSGIAALRGSRKGASSDALWLSMYGPPMTDNGIYDRSVTRTRDGLGQ